MARPRNTSPTYIPHAKSGRGRLQWYDALGIRHEKLLPGPFGSPEPINAERLAALLRRYGIRSAINQAAAPRARGYYRHDLEPVWTRYLPSSHEPV